MTAPPYEQPQTLAPETAPPPLSAESIADAIPFEAEALWVIAICAGCTVVVVETSKALFLDRKRRSRNRAVDRLDRALRIQAAKPSDFVDIVEQDKLDALREAADEAAASYNGAVGGLWLGSLFASAGLGVFWAWVAGWNLGYSALLGLLGGVFAKPAERYAEPALEYVLRRFGLRKPPDDDDDPPPRDRTGTREQFRTATLFGKARKD